jgi:hypothetical protein
MLSLIILKTIKFYRNSQFFIQQNRKYNYKSKWRRLLDDNETRQTNDRGITLSHNVS